jgi:ABC-type sugar transport system substrate-binding protein
MTPAEDIMKSRQAWFWRRTTLQVTLLALALVLAASMFITASRAGDWPTTVVQVAIVSAMAWLVTMYFAMVDNAAKVGELVKQIGDAVDKARE